MDTYYQPSEKTLFDQIEWLVMDACTILKDAKSRHEDLVDFLNLAIDNEGGSSDFELYDREIKDSLMSHVKVGVFLSRIARKCLYKAAGIGSFGEYCRRALGRTSSYCCRLMRAAKVTLQLMLAGFDRLPSNEAQCRPLVAIENEDELANKWQEVLDRADQAKNQAMRGVVTAALVDEVVNGTTNESATEKKKKVSLSTAVYSKLERLAKKSGKTIDELIDGLIDDRTLEPPGGVSEEQVSRWQDDLNDLIQESPTPEPTPEPAPEPAPITKSNNSPSEQISYHLQVCRREMEMGLCTKEQMKESARNLGYEVTDGGDFIYVGKPAVNPCKPIIDRIKQQLKSPKAAYSL